MSNFTKAQEPFSSCIIYLDFYTAIFICGITCDSNLEDKTTLTIA